MSNNCRQKSHLRWTKKTGQCVCVSVVDTRQPALYALVYSTKSQSSTFMLGIYRYVTSSRRTPISLSRERERDTPNILGPGRPGTSDSVRAGSVEERQARACWPVDWRHSTTEDCATQYCLLLYLARACPAHRSIAPTAAAAGEDILCSQHGSIGIN